MGNRAFYIIMKLLFHIKLMAVSQLAADDRTKLIDVGSSVVYLISAYFDDSTNRKLQQLIDGIAKSSGNSFMLEHNVPPHLTISAFETRRPDELIPIMEGLGDNINRGEVAFVSVGVFLPYVMYATPVLDDYLHNMAVEVYESVRGVDKGRQDVHAVFYKYANIDNDSTCTFAHNVNGGSCDSMRSSYGIEDIKVNKYYNPSKWFPHVTLGKTLNEEQIRTAFSYVQNHFVPFTGEILELGLAKTNPHEDIVRIELKGI